MLAGLSAATPAPTHLIKAKSSPKQVRCEIDGTPELDAAAAASGSFFKQPVDEGSPVQQQASIAANPYDKVTDDSMALSPDDVPHQVVVVIAGDYASLLVGPDDGCGGQPADAVAVKSKASAGEREQFELPSLGQRV